MKKALTFLSLMAFALLFVAGSTQAQVRTGKGDFFNITRTVEQTADSVTFVADTLTLFDNGGGIGNFMPGDSVVVMFVQNRFKIVNNMLGASTFDYIKARSTNAFMTLSRQSYTNVVTNVTPTTAVYGNDPAPGFASDVKIRPVYRPAGNIASSSIFNSAPTAIRQVLSMTINTPTNGQDGIQIRNIYFKPNINNLTGLALPPDTTKDTLRAYHLDGGLGPAGIGNVVSSTDLAIVRLLPGTSSIVMWVKDSAAAVDAGEYIGSFGDYSRGRYFLGDDGLPYAQTRTAQFRPSATRVLGAVTVQNPDEGMIIDGFPPERNLIRLSSLYQTLAPFYYTQNFPGVYPVLPGNPGSNPNPQNGLIPPYRPGAWAISANPYQPGIVSSAVDTVRFLDSWGNRTWDRMSQPVLKAFAYTINTPAPEDRSLYLKGYTAADDTLRQYGQIVYRRLAYTHADVGANVGAVEDSVRIMVAADIPYLGQGSIPGLRRWNDPNNTMAYAQIDTSGGFPRTFAYSVRVNESDLDNGIRTNVVWQIDDNRTPVDPSGLASLPYTGSKIVVRPNIPRAIDIRPFDQWKGTNDANYLRLDLVMTDGYGNTIDDNERFKFELSPYGKLSNGIPYRLNGLFDSLVTTIPQVVTTGLNIDSGRVFVNYSNMGRATRVFRAATGSNNIGAYRIRVRASYALNDKPGTGVDVHNMLKIDPNPGPGFLHVTDIPDGSPNNNFGVWFGPNTGYNAGFGRQMGQTTAMDSTDVLWDGSNWTYFPVQPRLEVVCGTEDALVVGRVGTFTRPGELENIYSKLYVRLTDIFGNPLDITPYFNAGKIKVELPDNPAAVLAYGNPLTKIFFGSVSPNVAYDTYSSHSVTGFDVPKVPMGLPNANDTLNAHLVAVPAGGTLPGIEGDVPALIPYSAMRFYLRAPANVKHLSLDGTDKIRIRAHLTVSTGVPNGGDFSVTSGVCEMSIIPDVVNRVEIFKSSGKPAGTRTPMEGWSPITPADAIAAGYPTGTPQNAAEVQEFYKGYYFRTNSPEDPETGNPLSGVTPRSSQWPTPFEAGYIGGWLASGTSLDYDCTTPIPMDTVVVSEHSQQIRVIARLLDRYSNPVGGRYVKFFVESETLPITPPKTQLQNNAQRGGFGEFNRTWVSDDTLKRSTIGDTATAGWVSAYFVSGRVAWQMVRIALTPDTLAFDLSSNGNNLGEGTVVGSSRRGFAPRVIIPIYQKSDTTVKVQIYPYTAAATSPIPLPVDMIDIQALESPMLYGKTVDYAPGFRAFSANWVMKDKRASHLGRAANTNIRPYIPDTLNLVDNDEYSMNSITAGRTVTLLAREYDRFGNLVDNQTADEDTARVRFRMWGADFNTAPPAPYGIGAGTIAPASDWTEDAYGPMRKARYRHTQISNLVAGVHINQTTFLTALEYPTPKLANATVYFEATATAVLNNSLPGAVTLNRDTVKVISVVKKPTRFDILRAGQEYRTLQDVGVRALSGSPENRVLSATANIGLPPGSDALRHDLSAVGVDNILLSQVYKRNMSPMPVGKVEIVNDGNVPLDKDGDPLFVNPNDTQINPNFDVDEYSHLPIYQKLDAYNNQNPNTAPNVRYNRLNAGTNIPGARQDGTIYDVSMAGGGNIANIITRESIGWFTTGNNTQTNQRPILLRATPVWENNAPTGGTPYDLTQFTGKNAQPGQVRVYENRLYADSVYTFRGSSSIFKGQTTRAEFMGTRTDMARTNGGYGSYPDTDMDRITRLGVGLWDDRDFRIAGLPNYAFSGNGPGLTGGMTANGQYFNADFNRRFADLGGAFGTQAQSTRPIAPGMFMRLVDSTAEQVIDLRIVDENLGIDDTCSYDRGKATVVRRNQRTSAQLGNVPWIGAWHVDDTYKGGLAGIQGPNALSTDETETANVRRDLDMSIGGISFFTGERKEKIQHTFVVTPYRIAYTSIFPSSFDVTQGLFDDTRLPLGILPVQADIDTLPRVALKNYGDGVHDATDFEMYTRLYGQIVHGATDAIPNNLNQPYARPDTVFRDIRYTYAITPYDRYGNMNTRDTMFVQIGSRFTDWEFRDLEADGTLMIRSGGGYFGAIPRNTPTNNQFRQDTLRVFNPRGQGLSVSRNDILGMKPDDKRLSLTVGSETGTKIPHGLLPGNVIASRPVWVKMPYAPAPFVLSTPALQNRSLFRMDHVGGCVDNGIEKDLLRLQWQPSTWPAGSGQNNPNDTIKYEWYAIIDSVGANSSGSLTVSILSDDNGTKPSLTLPGDQLRQLIFRPSVQPQPNRDSLVMRVKWFVRAFSKTGLETFSDTAGATIRNNPLPTPPLVISINRPPTSAPQPVQPTNGQTISGITATTTNIPVIWTAAQDINIDKGVLIGGFKVYSPATQTWIDEAGRTVDTLTYQWVGVVASTFPVGKGAAIGTTIVRNTGVTAGFQLSSADFDALFAGFDTDPNSTSADSVKLDWYVFVKDFNFTDALPMEEVTFRYDANGTMVPDTTLWSRFGCRPHELVGGPYRLNLTKLDQGGVEIDPAAGAPDIDKIAGEQICFKLTAKDKNGNIIRDWDQKGQATTITIKGSDANTDSSQQTWNSDPLGYTFAVITSNGNQLTSISANEFSIPASEFKDGVATICITHTKALRGVTLETSPILAGLNQISANMNFVSGEITNFLVDLTSATAPTPDQVYLLRRYEIVVSPRDRYLNVSNAQIRTRFSARFPGEFDQNMPGLSDIFSGDVFITGPTNYFLASRLKREKGTDELQWVRAFKFDDPNVTGQTSPYEILKHAPNQFALTAPADQTVLKLQTASTLEQFKWVKATPQDPYTNIVISRFSPVTETDDVKYTLVYLDSVSLTRAVKFASDNVGVEPTLTTTQGQLADLINTISGQPNQKAQGVVWYVEATDGLFTTLSSPPTADPNGRPGYRLSLIKEGILAADGPTPTQYELSQNYPNPFNPTTSISYSLPKAGQVTVVVYDLLGTPVKTLVNETKEAGSYNLVWDATNDLGVQVPSGNYIYKIQAGSFTQTRKMTLLK